MLVLPADKGKVAVMMDTKEYMDKIRVILSDESMYKKLKKDPKHGYKEKVVALLIGLKDKNKISWSQYRDLYPMCDVVSWQKMRS